MGLMAVVHGKYTSVSIFCTLPVLKFEKNVEISLTTVQVLNLAVTAACAPGTFPLREN